MKGKLRALNHHHPVVWPSPGPFLVSLTEALLPFTEASLLSPPQYDAVVSDSAGFVAQQIDGLCAPLRLATRVGLLCFEGATFLRFRRRLHAVPLESRVKWVERWAYGTRALPRQLLRAVRCNALVAFYDHPAAKAALTDLRGRSPSSKFGVSRVA